MRIKKPSQSSHRGKGQTQTRPPRKKQTTHNYTCPPLPTNSSPFTALLTSSTTRPANISTASTSAHVAPLFTHPLPH
jgi:hypothetical protein